MTDSDPVTPCHACNCTGIRAADNKMKLCPCDWGQEYLSSLILADTGDVAGAAERIKAVLISKGVELN